jgi:hypothetical protein
MPGPVRQAPSSHRPHSVLHRRGLPMQSGTSASFHSGDCGVSFSQRGSDINHLLYQPKLAFPYVISGRLSGQLLQRASATRPPEPYVNVMAHTPHAPPEITRVDLTATALCTPFGGV